MIPSLEPDCAEAPLPIIVFETNFGRRTVIVTGGRDFQDRECVFRELDALSGKICDRAPLGTICLTIVHGDCLTGADRWADEWAVINGAPVNSYPADWKRWGAAAGPIRNEKIVKYHPNADLCLAFPGGNGTADMVERCKRAGIPVKEIAA